MEASAQFSIKQVWARNQDILLVLCGQGFNREYQGHYNRFKVLIGGKPIQEVFTDEELKDLSYWVNRSKVLAMTCWGTSQKFEAQISLGRFLGYDSKDWPAFSHLVEEKFKVV